MIFVEGEDVVRHGNGMRERMQPDNGVEPGTLFRRKDGIVSDGK
jgi:hypothetical protein